VDAQSLTAAMLPLHGITVVDLTRLVPGPYASMVLADLGARVIKVESPSAPDILRFPEPHLDGSNVGFSSLNRNKESLIAELTRPEGAEVVARLARRADVLVTSTRPGFLEAHGLGHAELSRDNPGLISCALRGYSQGSPDGRKGGHDINFLALSGLAHTIRDENGRPVVPDVQVGDVAGAMNAVLAIMAALLARASSGLGQELEISLTSSCTAFTVLLEAAALQGVEQATIGGGLLAGRSPAYRYYRCADGGWIALGAIERKYQARVLEILRSQCPEGRLPQEQEWPEDLFFGWRQGQAASRAMEQIFATRTRDEWTALFAGVDACFTPVLSVAEAVAHSGRRRDVSTLQGDSVAQPAGLLQESFPPPGPGRAAAPPGLHTRSILQELGYQEGEIAALVAQGAVRGGP
jgi:crotonobetainyl-CoA:carnitine CoA-transferase CaiB-like acyl-CoA transferase